MAYKFTVELEVDPYAVSNLFEFLDDAPEGIELILFELRQPDDVGVKITPPKAAALIKKGSDLREAAIHKRGATQTPAPKEALKKIPVNRAAVIQVLRRAIDHIPIGGEFEGSTVRLRAQREGVKEHTFWDAWRDMVKNGEVKKTKLGWYTRTK